MRHFCSTTTKPEYENQGVLAHKGLQEQPEGVHERETKVSRFFVGYQKVLLRITFCEVVVVYASLRTFWLSTIYIATQLAIITPIAKLFAKIPAAKIKKSIIALSFLLVYDAKVWWYFDNPCQKSFCWVLFVQMRRIASYSHSFTMLRDSLPSIAQK